MQRKKSTADCRVAIYRGPKNISGVKVAEALTALGIEHAFITAGEIARGGLDNFAAAIFPGGHSIRIGTSGERALKRWLAAGGGVVGICAGCQFGAQLKLLPVQHHIWRASGIVDLRIVAKHSITRGYTVAGRHRSRATWKYSPRGRVRMRYANGGLLTPTASRAKVLVSYDEAGEFGAVVAGRYGQRGRVVLIAPHPESTPAAHPGGADADRSQEPLPMFGQAVTFAMGTAGARIQR